MKTVACKLTFICYRWVCASTNTVNDNVSSQTFPVVLRQLGKNEVQQIRICTKNAGHLNLDFMSTVPIYSDVIFRGFYSATLHTQITKKSHDTSHMELLLPSSSNLMSPQNTRDQIFPKSHRGCTGTNI